MTTADTIDLLDKLTPGIEWAELITEPPCQRYVGQGEKTAVFFVDADGEPWASYVNIRTTRTPARDLGAAPTTEERYREALVRAGILKSE